LHHHCGSLFGWQSHRTKVLLFRDEYRIRLVSRLLRILEEKTMKAMTTLKLAASALIVVTSIGGWSEAGAQASAAPSTESAMAPSGGMTAKDARKANRALSRKVRGALVKTSGISASNINVLVKNGAVTLAGSVPDQTQIDKAGEVAKGVPGVMSVKNALVVKEPGQ
jgi:hyperosmotically inducible protein